jgi:hypothetical protein
MMAEHILPSEFSSLVSGDTPCAFKKLNRRDRGVFIVRDVV